MLTACRHPCWLNWHLVLRIVRLVRQAQGPDHDRMLSQLPHEDSTGSDHAVMECRIKCWPNGRLVLRVAAGERTSGSVWQAQGLHHDLMLPGPVDPHSAGAILSLHGELMLTVNSPSP